MQRTGDAELNPENQRWWRQHCGKETSTQKQHPHTLSSCAATLPATHTHTRSKTPQIHRRITLEICACLCSFYRLGHWHSAAHTHTHTHTHTQQQQTVVRTLFSLDGSCLSGWLLAPRGIVYNHTLLDRGKYVVW